MKAKSDLLAADRRTRPAGRKPRKRPPLRLPREERRAQILAQAYKFFSEYGLTAQTRALAEACGVSQRLLYSFFPSKAALLEEVYRSEIAGSFKAVWFVELKDRGVPLEQRLTRFYREYYDVVTTRRWLRLFLYASLAEVGMAPAYIAAIVTHMLEIVVAEAAHEHGLRVPADGAQVQEIGWVLHGAVSHLAIRRHIYANTNPLPAHDVIALHVRSFLAGLPALLEPQEIAPRNDHRQLTTK
jgi:AcrR family transcriptional regulator